MSESFAKGAFTGELSQDLVFPYPSMDPDQAEIVEMLRDSIRKFAAEHIDVIHVRTERDLDQVALQAV